MALPKQYLTSKHAKIEDYFETVFAGQAPEKFTISFLKQLGFTSSNDNLFVGVLKALNFLEENGAPTERYYQALDQSNRKKLVADGIKEAYFDLFSLDRNAQDMNIDTVKGKFKTLTAGKVKDKTIHAMARTYEELCKYADWNGNDSQEIVEESIKSTDKVADTVHVNAQPGENIKSGDKVNVDFKYDIHIHLPATRDVGIYDALFTSLKKHLID